MNTEALYKLFLEHPTADTDSRRIRPGSIFFALKGPLHDGNTYAGEALSKGSALAVVDDPGIVTGAETILVDDALRALQDLASYHREQLGIPVLAVTGSNGKTTTKELIMACVSEKMNAMATRGNLNNNIGVPLSLLELKKGHEFAVIEMGASSGGEIGALCRIARPDYGLITNLGKAHLEGFGSEEGVRKAKGELYAYLGQEGKTIFVDFGDRVLFDMARKSGAGLVGYGEGDGTLVEGTVVRGMPKLELELRYRGADRRRNVVTGVFGSYNMANYLAAACVAEYLGIDRESACRALESYQPGNMRSQIIESGTNTVVLDAYNANPSSMKAAITDFSRMAAEHRVLVLGEMLELGKYAVGEHESLISGLSAQDFDLVCLVGSIFDGIDLPGNARVFGNTGELSAFLRQHPLRNSAILVKGSRLLALEQILPMLA